jgi:hypothetical protein
MRVPIAQLQQLQIRGHFKSRALDSLRRGSGSLTELANLS